MMAINEIVKIREGLVENPYREDTVGYKEVETKRRLALIALTELERDYILTAKKDVPAGLMESLILINKLETSVNLFSPVGMKIVEAAKLIAKGMKE